MPDRGTLSDFFNTRWTCDPAHMNNELVSVVDFVLVVWPLLVTTGRGRAALPFLQAIEAAVVAYGNVPLFIDRRTQRCELDMEHYPHWIERNACALSSPEAGYEAALCAVIFAREFEIAAAATTEERVALAKMANTVMAQINGATINGLLPCNSAFVSNVTDAGSFPIMLSTQVLLHHAHGMQGNVAASHTTRQLIDQHFWDEEQQTYIGEIGHRALLDIVGSVLAVLHNIGGRERSRSTMAKIKHVALLPGGALLRIASPYRHIHATHLGDSSGIVLPVVLSLLAIAFAEVKMDTDAKECISCLDQLPSAVLWLHPGSGQQAGAPSVVSAAAVLLAASAIDPGETMGLLEMVRCTGVSDCAT